MKPSYIGGQAVMEGIMMRNGAKYAVGVRKPDQEIEVKVEDYRSVFGNLKLMKLPIFRGVASFVDSLVIGTKCLMYSASFFEDEDEESIQEKQKKYTGTQEEIRRQMEADKKKQEKRDKWLMNATMVFSVVLAVGLFMVLPYLLASLLKKIGVSEFGVTVAEAVVKMALFLGYMVLISRMKDIQRTFMYHGAEHKCINCIENGLELNVENVMKSSRQHKRCGTSFLLLVMVVSVLMHFIFVLVPVMWLRVAGRILLIPVVAGVAFEFIRLAGKSENPIVCAVSRPGLALQKLTTREPDESMVEVAIAAVEAVFDWKTYLKENFGYAEPESEKEAP